MEKPKIICWDSCVLIDFLQGDASPRVRSLDRVLDGVDKKSIKLVFSTLIYPEVLETKMPEGVIKKMDEFMGFNEVDIIPVDIRIAKKARLIRDKTRIKTPDAVMVATAIESGAVALHTSDDELLKLDMKSAVDELPITNCTIPGESPSLFLPS